MVFLHFNYIHLLSSLTTVLSDSCRHAEWVIGCVCQSSCAGHPSTRVQPFSGAPGECVRSQQVPHQRFICSITDVYLCYPSRSSKPRPISSSGQFPVLWCTRLSLSLMLSANQCTALPLLPFCPSQLYMQCLIINIRSTQVRETQYNHWMARWL